MNNDLLFETGLACIVFIGYIVCKVWIYHKADEDEGS